MKGPGYTTTFLVFKQVSSYYNTFFVADFYQHYFLKWPRLAKASILLPQTCNYAHVIYWRLTMLTKFHFKFPTHDMILHVLLSCRNILCSILELCYCWWDYAIDILELYGTYINICLIRICSTWMAWHIGHFRDFKVPTWRSVRNFASLLKWKVPAVLSCTPVFIRYMLM